MSDLIIAFDPSLSCTGYAVLRGREGEHLEDAGIVKAEDEKSDQYTRARSITEQALDVLGRYAATPKAMQVRAVVIESPRTNGAGLRGQRSTAWLPGYGMVVGVLTYGVDLLRGGYGFKLMRPSASEWTRGYPPTHGDQEKRARVELVCGMYGLEAGALGPKSVAGNVADAVLLGRWAAIRAGS